MIRDPIRSDAHCAVAIQCNQPKGSLKKIVVHCIIGVVGVHRERKVVLR